MDGSKLIAYITTGPLILNRNPFQRKAKIIHYIGLDRPKINPITTNLNIIIYATQMFQNTKVKSNNGSKLK